MAPEEPANAGPGPQPEAQDAGPEAAGRSAPLRLLAWLARLARGAAHLGSWLALALAALLVAALAFLHSPAGRQFVADQIGAYKPASGLRIEIGRIEGSVLWSATLRDVRLRDARGTLFLEVPAIDLGWRPHKFLFGSLDIRHLVLRRGTLHATPQLRPGDPEAPLLPGFDIRIRRLAFDDLTVSSLLPGGERVIDFAASLAASKGLVRLDAGGNLGGEEGRQDRFSLRLDAAPDANRFDLDLDWRAPAGGFLSGLTGIREELLVSLAGKGRWENWEGTLRARLAGSELLDFQLRNQAGRYRLAGRARPGALVEGIVARAMGELVTLQASASLEDRVVQGEFVLRGRALNAAGAGQIDLAQNRLDQFSLTAQLLDPALFGPDLLLHDARLAATIDGPFARPSVAHVLEIGRIEAGARSVHQARQRGRLTYADGRLVLPLEISVGRIVTGTASIDPRLVAGRARGVLTHDGGRLAIPALDVRFAGLGGRLAIRTDLASGRTRIAGPIEVSALPLAGIGTLDGGANIRLAFGGSARWSLRAQAAGQLGLPPAGAAAGLVGPDLRLAGGFATGEGQPLFVEYLRLDAAKLHAELAGETGAGGTRLEGSGTHGQYGAFAFGLAIDEAGPRANLALASPLPAAGLTDVAVALAPAGEGFAIEASGQSLLGPFSGLAQLVVPAGGEMALALSRLDIGPTRITGALRLAATGIDGALRLGGGGIDGAIVLAPSEGGQGFSLDLSAYEARLGGDSGIGLARGTIQASGRMGAGLASFSGEMALRGLDYGGVFLGRVAARGRLENGVGSVDAALSGARGRRFELALNGRIAPGRIALAVRGDHAGRALAMPRPAILMASEAGGWDLQRSQISYGDGFMIASGHFGGAEPFSLRLALGRLPLALASALGTDLGLGGTVSGIVDLLGSSAAAGGGGHPSGLARLTVAGLTRSSALVTSQPVDIALVAQLGQDRAQARAVLAHAAGTRERVSGRLQVQLVNLPERASLAERLSLADLHASLRVEGAAASLWRIAALDLLDLTGNVRLAAEARGTLRAPRLAGAFAGDGLRVQSFLTGTDLRNAMVRGRVRGQRIELLRFAGTAPNGGQVSASGVIDLGTMASQRGPGIDLRLAARNAQILDLPMMVATITGPLRVVSGGVGGTVAGRVQINSARWRLGAAEQVAQLPAIEIRQSNLPADTRPVVAEAAPWRFLLDARAPGGMMVTGLGLDSEWRGALRLRGTTADPRLGGEVEVVPRQGFYDFAGVRFALTRGRILFDENEPINPRLNIVAQSNVNAINVAVNIEGEAIRPQITFTSTPPLPEEELLSQMLFGGSLANLSATDALQLGAALASLRGGGGGLDPINQLRGVIGVDRLQLVAADPALGRGAAVAIGKNITRRLYAEVITDGAGYNATDLEFRITSWLSLLGTVNSIGRDSATFLFNRDY